MATEQEQWEAKTHFGYRSGVLHGILIGLLIALIVGIALY